MGSPARRPAHLARVDNRRGSRPSRAVIRFRQNRHLDGHLINEYTLINDSASVIDDETLIEAARDFSREPAKLIGRTAS
jgi:hypothetical protein